MKQLRPNFLAVACALLVIVAGRPGEAAPAAIPSAATLFDRIDAGAFAEAESLSLVALAAKPSTRDSAGYIDVLVFARWRNDRETNSGNIPLAERGLAIRERWPGRDSLDLAWSLETLAYVRTAASKLDQAGDLARRSLAIRVARLPPQHPDISRLIQLLGSIAYRARNYREALARYDEALTLREHAVPRRVVDVARSRMAGAAAHMALKEDSAAVVALEQAVQELEPTPGRDLLYALNSLSTALGAMDLYREARAIAVRAVELAERVLGPDHLQTGYAYRSLGFSCRLDGDYASARDAYERALPIFEHLLGPDDIVTTNADRLLIGSLNKVGDFAAAYAKAQQGLARAQARQPPDSVAMVQLLNSMAFATEGMGRVADATPLYQRAYVISAAANGPDDPSTGFQLTNLGGNLLDLGQPARAESVLVRACAILEKHPAELPSNLVSAVRGVALARMERGNYAGADSLLNRGMDLIQTRLAGLPTEAALLWRDRAWLGIASGRRALAVDAALRVDSLGRAHQQLLTQGLAEREALAFAAVRPTGIPVALTLAADAQGLGAADRRRVWDSVIRSRAFVLDEMAARTQFEHQDDPEVAALVASLREARERLAALDVRGPGRDPEHFESERNERRAAAERAEVALSRRSAAFRRQDVREWAGFDEVAASMPSGGALVAFVRYRNGERGPGTPTRESYLAFALPAGAKDPVVVPLGDAASLDSLVQRWNAAAGRPLPANAAGAKRAAADARARGEQLRARMWDPVRARLGSPSLVLIVPDGLLHRVAIAALPQGKDRWVVESGPTLHLLTAERDLVAPPLTPSGKGMLALGDPTFDAAESMPLIAAANPPSETVYRGARSKCAEFSRLRFPPLPGSRQEAEEIMSLWKQSPAGAVRGELLEGEAATEHAFKSLAGGRRVLHLATHGFFLDANCAAADAASGTRGVAGLTPWDEPKAKPAATLTIASAPARLLENPLLLSGLALAGANQRDSVAAGAEDGILTADEIASLDLSGTEWAVLSACRTGVGPIATGEGVLGLRRAFQVAGARTVIASLWTVGDRSARRWMEALYRARYERGLSTAEAVRAASLEVLREQRAAKAVETPLEWAAFQAAGDWR